MSNSAKAANWAAFDASVAPIDTSVDVTPGASSALLAAVNAVVQAVAVTPYAGCGHLTWRHGYAAGAATSNVRCYFTIAVQPGAVHARISIWDRIKPAAKVIPVKHVVYTTSGGTAGVNLVEVPMLYQVNGAASNEPQFFGGVDRLTESSTDAIDAPTAASNRLLELTPIKAPALEACYVDGVQSFCVRCVHTASDLAAL